MCQGGKDPMHDMNGAFAREKKNTVPLAGMDEEARHPGDFGITKKSMPKDLISHKNGSSMIKLQLISTSGSLATSWNPLFFPRILRHPQQTSRHQKSPPILTKVNNHQSKLGGYSRQPCYWNVRNLVMLTFHPGSSFCLKCSKGTIFQQLVSCTNVT